MNPRRLPRSPVYIISKGRHDCCLTANFMKADGVPFRIAVEPQEAELYEARYPGHVEVLPFANLGLGGIPARNWCWEHAKAAGHEKHWLFDDNIRRVRRFWKGKRVPCDAGPALAAVEDFADRYENLAIAGLNYDTFVRAPDVPPFVLNCHVYSCLLIRNDLPQRWRGRYNEDTDLCLQVLAAGLCTVLVNAFLIEKMQTMKLKGGNAAELYKGDGRLKMARSLERAWPYVVETKRRFLRPQHVIRGAWRKFDTPLKRKPGVELPAAPDDYGMRVKVVDADIQSPLIQELAGRKS